MITEANYQGGGTVVVLAQNYSDSEPDLGLFERRLLDKIRLRPGSALLGKPLASLGYRECRVEKGLNSKAGAVTLAHELAHTLGLTDEHRPQNSKYLMYVPSEGGTFIPNVDYAPTDGGPPQEFDPVRSMRRTAAQRFR